MSTRIEPDRLFTIEQAAEATNYDTETIRRWMDRGMPFVAAADGKKRPRAKDVRIRASDLWRWVEGLVISRRPLEEKNARAKVAAKGGAGGGLTAWRAARGVK